MVARLIDKLYHNFIVWGYKRYGLMYGDELSYSFVGECVNSVESRYHFFRVRYCNLGYVPVPLDDWITAGGYRGESHIQPMMLIKREEK